MEKSTALDKFRSVGIFYRSTCVLPGEKPSGEVTTPKKGSEKKDS